MRSRRRCSALDRKLSSAVAGYQWERATAGKSASDVYRLHGMTDAQNPFLKHGRGAVADDITEEMVRLRWLAAHVPVPTVQCVVCTGDAAWLLTTAVRGATAARILEEANHAGRRAVVEAMAAFLQRLHAIPVPTCPFNSDHAFRLGRARARIDAGQVDARDFDAERHGWTAQRACGMNCRSCCPSQPTVS